MRKFDISSLKRWTARRAYKYGWSKRLFPDDSSHYGDYTRSRSYVERIGKKYQWIALDELRCRLADNYWTGASNGDSTKMYENPLDIGFERDIDPTIIPLSDISDNTHGLRSAWMLGDDISLEHCEDSELPQWPFAVDPGASILNHISKSDDEGRQWVNLYEHISKAEKYEEKEGREHGFRQQEFRVILCIVLSKSDRKDFVEYLTKKRQLDVFHWDPPEHTDGPYLLEAPWSKNWPQQQWDTNVWGAPEGMKISFPAFEYHWESHLDASLPNGVRALVPSPWLTRALNIWPDRCDASVYRDNGGDIIFAGSNMADGGSFALVEASRLGGFLDANDLQCVWLFVGERNVWPGGGNANAAWRRSEGLCWIENAQRNKGMLVAARPGAGVRHIRGRPGKIGGIRFFRIPDCLYDEGSRAAGGHRLTQAT